MVGMNGDDHHTEIVRLEEQIDQLEATIESCREFILVGQIAVASGSVILIAMLVGGIQLNLSVMGLAAAAVLSGIVAVGSNRSTANEASGELTALEAKRVTLIGQLDPSKSFLKSPLCYTRITIRWKIEPIRLNPPNHTYSIPAAGVLFAMSL
jgi:hypothetical protein